MKSLSEWQQLFDTVNADAQSSGESVVPYEEAWYYIEQIQNIEDMPYREAFEIASKLGGRI